MKKLSIDTFYGKKFGKLSLINFFIKDKKTFCNAICDCGNIKSYCFSSLNQGLTKSCGCIRKEKNNNSKYKYNTNIFKNLNENTLYILGLLYTDGNITGNFRFSIGLKIGDHFILKKIGKLIRNSENLIYEKPKKSPSSNNYTKGSYILSCNNKEIIKDLLNLGLFPNKTNKIKPKECLINSRDFWRGCIDGDGWVRYNKKYLIIGFGGTKEMCEGLLNFCKKFIKIKSKIQKRTENNYHEISISGKKAEFIHKILYENSILFIERKKFPDKFTEEAALNRNLEKERKILEN